MSDGDSKIFKSFFHDLKKKTRQYLRYHSTPIYCMYLSCTRFTNMTICIRSRDINKDTFQDKLINQIKKNE